MSAWLIPLAYLALGLLTARRVAYAILLQDKSPDHEDRILAAVMGLLAGVVWPVTALILLFSRAIPKTPSELKADAKRAAARAEAAEAIVREFTAEHGKDGQRGVLRSGDDEWRF